MLVFARLLSLAVILMTIAADYCRLRNHSWHIIPHRQQVEDPMRLRIQQTQAIFCISNSSISITQMRRSLPGTLQDNMTIEFAKFESNILLYDRNPPSLSTPL